MANKLTTTVALPHPKKVKHQLGRSLYKCKLFTMYEVFRGCYYLAYNKSSTMGHSFCRIQEFYESPKFANKIFTKQEYITWWKANAGQGVFTYPNYFVGYNLPSRILLPFLSGQFDPLSRLEREILKAVAHIPVVEFYLIASHKSDAATITHEVCHGAYGLCEEYRNEVNSILEQYKDLQPFCFKCLKDTGYKHTVFLDEMNAFMAADGYKYLSNLHGNPKFHSVPPSPARGLELQRKLSALFVKWYTHLKINP